MLATYVYCIYHLHLFEQKGEIRAIGVTKAIIWDKGKALSIHRLVEETGYRPIRKKVPEWISHMFENDYEYIKNYEKNIDYHLNENGQMHTK